MVEAVKRRLWSWDWPLPYWKKNLSITSIFFCFVLALLNLSRLTQDSLLNFSESYEEWLAIKNLNLKGDIFSNKSTYILHRARPTYEKLVRHTALFFYFLCHACNIRNQRRLSSRLSIPMFVGTPCSLFIQYEIDPAYFSLILSVRVASKK